VNIAFQVLGKHARQRLDDTVDNDTKPTKALTVARLVLRRPSAVLTMKATIRYPQIPTPPPWEGPDPDPSPQNSRQAHPAFATHALYAYPPHRDLSRSRDCFLNNRKPLPRRKRTFCSCERVSCPFLYISL